jgi:ABC-type hemin transport system substrate-binding protein
VRWLVGLTLLLALGCSKRTEEKAPPPTTTMRVISLTPSATEVMAALGATSMLVGVDEY